MFRAQPEDKHVNSYWAALWGPPRYATDVTETTHCYSGAPDLRYHIYCARAVSRTTIRGTIPGHIFRLARNFFGTYAPEPGVPGWSADGALGSNETEEGILCTSGLWTSTWSYFPGEDCQLRGRAGYSSRQFNPGRKTPALVIWLGREPGRTRRVRISLCTPLRHVTTG